MFRYLVLAAYMAAMTLAPNLSGAQGTGGGSIFYDLNGVTYTMNSDGSNKTALPVGVVGVPSRALHGGFRWFLSSQDLPGETYPNGTTRREVFAIRSDGLLTVQLTTQPDLELTDSLDPLWMLGDNLSFIGRRWAGGTVVEGGIYTAEVVFDGLGMITGLSAQPAAPAIANALVLDASGYPAPNMMNHDWSPDGMRAVYNNLGARELWVATLLNAHTRIYFVTSGSIRLPKWSPADKIAFARLPSIWTINPDGSSAAERIKGSFNAQAFHPHWSPTGSHLAYSVFAGGAVGQEDVFRATASGATKKNLTNTGSPINERPIGWR